LIVRLSGSSIRTENIYCDAPRCTPDGRRIATLRYIDEITTPEKWLICHDVETKLTCGLDDKVIDVPVAPAFGGVIYYRRGKELRKVSLETGDIAVIMDMSPLPACAQLYSVSPDQRYLLYSAILARDPVMYNLVRLDLRDKSWKLMLDEQHWDFLLRKGASDRGMAGEFNPVHGRTILLSAVVWNAERTGRLGVGYLADADGRNAREVLAGVHHAATLADTGWIAGLLPFDYTPEGVAHRPETPEGELFLFATDGQTPRRFIPTPDHVLYHLSASRCGRYLVGEGLEGGATGPVPIVVINAFTGTYRTLVRDCRCSPAGDCGRQAKPYFTATSRHVIYTADPDGIVNVFSAEIPPGFLESLG
jgi:hypothetical protein